MSAFSRFPKTPASRIVHKWVVVPQYGQIRKSDSNDDYRFMVLCPVPDLDVWSVLLLSPGPPEITQHGTAFIENGTRLVTPGWVAP